MADIVYNQFTVRYFRPDGLCSTSCAVFASPFERFFYGVSPMHINIKNWTKFQHYKDRRPKWIKLLIEIIDEFDEDGLPKKFHPLPDSAKLTFVMLACLRANYNKYIPYPNKKWLQKRLGISTINLQPLVDAGFICIDTEMIQDGTEMIQERPNSLPPERERERERETERETDTRFDVFWKAYPKKKSKDAAQRRWEALKPDAELLQTMLVAIEQQKKCEQWLKDGGQFVPNPATWLNGGCWKDELPPPKETMTERIARVSRERY